MRATESSSFCSLKHSAAYPGQAILSSSSPCGFWDGLFIPTSKEIFSGAKHILQKLKSQVSARTDLSLTEKASCLS